MRMYDLIVKKKRGDSLSKSEIEEMIQKYTCSEIPDYQMSAMLMAICFQGLDDSETLNLTLAMRDSGDVIDLSDINGMVVDKHSTGGVGDKTSLILAPILAACGLKVAKMSGRGLGHTGGTIDKLESFPGFSSDLSEAQFKNIVNEIGMAIAGQTKTLAPADKKLYALRDVTATVDQVSLIASSILSKKLASGSDVIVLDVKTGNGAFMKTQEEAINLAETMVTIGKLAGKNIAAVISDMDQPLGNAVGNAIEVEEAIQSLLGNGPADLMEVVTALASQLLLMTSTAESHEDAIARINASIISGAAMDRFVEFIAAQGGDREDVLSPSRRPKAKFAVPVKARKDGFVTRILAEDIGIACMEIGGGRLKKEDTIDLLAGIYLWKKRGDKVQIGDTIATIHANDMEKAQSIIAKIQNAYSFSEEEPEPIPMIKQIL
ncbi:MAG: thymidine phosphorylase [Lachnospiraceae bacterium]